MILWEASFFLHLV